MLTLKVQSRKTQRGFTLLEVLIAIVVFSIGLLGIAGLQVSGMRFTHGSQLRAIAVAQAETLADRMRADPVGVDLKFYNRNLGVMPTAADAGFVDCYTLQCTSQQLANFTLASWNKASSNNASTNASRPKESNADVLPGGDGIVCVDSTPADGKTGAWACDNLGDTLVIKVSWNERLINDKDVGTSQDETSDTGVKTIFVRIIPYSRVPGDHVPTTNS